MQVLSHVAPHEQDIINGDDNGKLQSRLEESCSQCSSKSLGSSSLSITSNASSCAKISPPNSFNGLRRSTFDLSDYINSSNSTIPSKSPEGETKCTLRYRGSIRSSQYAEAAHGAATRALMDLTARNKDKSSSSSSSQDLREPSSRDCYGACCETSLTSATAMEHGDTKYLGSILDDVFLGYMSLLCLVVAVERRVRGVFHEVGNFFGALTTAFHFEEPLERQPVADNHRGSLIFCTSSQSMIHETMLEVQEKSKEELLTPLKLVTPAPSLASSDDGSTDDASPAKDEWGHFADFQEELADESSFIPSCSKVPARRRSNLDSSLSCLAPLAEVGEDEEDEEDWTF